MDRFRVVICGGGVAALEGLLRLHRLADDAVQTTLIAPNEEFSYRALSVKEPFALGPPERIRVSRIVEDAGAEWVRESVERIDLAGQLAHTDGGQAVPFDALLVAVGARPVPAYEHVTTFRDAAADETVGGIVQDLEEGYSASVAFIAPDGPIWPLPLYELALMTARRIWEAGLKDLQIDLITSDPAPLTCFGSTASEAVAQLLEQAGIRVHTGSTATVPEARRVIVEPEGVELGPARTVAMPRLEGQSIRGLTHGREFIEIDAHCRVPGTSGRVFAAGDGAAFPVKHGGLGAQQADTAAAAIARLAGVDVEAPAFQPVVHGVLLTGGDPLYMTARMVGGQGFRSEVSDKPLWSSTDKVSAEELTKYLPSRA